MARETARYAGRDRSPRVLRSQVLPPARYPERQAPAPFSARSGRASGTAVENVNRAERLGIIRDTQEWLGARGLRNRLVHEYVDDLDALAASLDVARRFTTVLIEAAHAFRSYAEQRLGVPARRDRPI